MLAKDPSLIAPGAARLARLPGGHQEGWPDAFFNVLRSVYAAVAQHGGNKPALAFPTFEDGYHVACLIDAVLESHRQGGVWRTVQAVELAGSVR